MAKTGREERKKLSFKDLLDEMNRSTKLSLSESTKEFQAVQEALQDVVNLSESIVDTKSARDMVEAHEKLGKACDAYINARKGAATYKGKDRLELVSVISDLQKKEADGVNAMRNPSTLNDNMGKKWIDVLATQRAREMNVTDMKLSTVGAGSSTRTVVPLGDGKNGFFTEDQTILSKEDFYQERIRTAKSKNVKKAFENLWKDGTTGESLSDVIMYSNTPEDIDRMLETYVKESLCVNAIKAIRWEDIRKNPHDKSEFLNGLVEIKRFITSSDLLEMGKIKEGSLPARNVASSRLAALLGQDTLLARSEVVCLKNGNEIRKGVMMQEAMGLDISKIKTREQELAFGSVDDFSNPDLQRQVTSLEVLDYLSAQIDRHGGNMFYQFEKDAAGNPKLIGIQGIDNDAAFGTLVSQKGVRRMVNINEITMMDETLAAGIQNVNQADLEYVFGDLLNAEEIEALGKRFEHVKNQISEKVRLMKPDEWDARTADEILNRPGYLGTIKEDFEDVQKKLPAMERETAGKETKERVTTKDLQEEKKKRIPKLGAYRENKVKELKTPVLQRNR